MMIEVTLRGQGGNRTQHAEVSMALTQIDRNATTAATQRIWQRALQTAEDVKPVAAQVKPLANDTRAAASRGLLRARSWAAPQVDRTGQVLQDTVAPKVAAALHSSAQRLDPVDPEKPKRYGWRMVVGITVLLAVAGAIVAGLRSRRAPGATTAAGEDEPGPHAEQAETDAARAS
jgi:hypothetical protein